MSNAFKKISTTTASEPGGNETVTTAPEPKPPWWKKEIGRARIKPVDLMNFSRQCASFIRAGIPILDALDVLIEDMTSTTLRKVLVDAASSLRAGSSLSQAIDLHADLFPDYYVSILHSAELTGNLDTVFDQLAAYIERDLVARRKIKSALTYPGVVMAMAVVTVVILSAWVLPRFKTFFKSLDAKLPLPTRILLSITTFLADWWWAIVLIVAIIVVAAVLALRKRSGRRLRDSLLLKMPGLGIVIRYAIVERFCRILASMVQAGVPLPDAMAVAADSANNLVYFDALTEAREAMVRGEGLARPIADTGLFPSGANQMLRVGETTGTLDQQLSGAATFFERELDYRLKRFADLFEPAVIVVVGLVVGFVAVALVSAMYGVFQQVNT
jgi:type IV pilus assembly protein PilC